VKEKLRVGVIGTGRWAGFAHLPGWKRSPLVDLAVVCDIQPDRAESRAKEFDVPAWTTDFEKVLARDDIDVVDIVTSGDNHEPLTFAALEAGKHVLVEKPVCHDYKDVWRAHKLAQSKGLKTKVGLTFRYAPAMQYMYELIEEGFVGQPFVFNGWEQNSQFIDPEAPSRFVRQDTGDAPIKVGSLEGYGAPTIDISLWVVGSQLTQVTGILKNFVTHRRNPDGSRVRHNVDDGDIYIGEYANGAICSMQSSYVTVGNYPGIEARIFGSEGAIKVRLVEEFGVIQTIHTAAKSAVEFVQREIPPQYFPPGYQASDPWSTAFYGNLVHNFCQEILAADGTNQGDFAQSARVQEVINAVAISHRQHRWVELPLKPTDDAAVRTSPF
jgi:predicted dehydrogenase